MAVFHKSLPTPPHPTPGELCCLLTIYNNPSFLLLLQFLVGHFDPKFKCGSKIEEEIPRLMRNLGYPFMISKSSLFTVGSPHTWPILLAALSWLRERIEMSLGLERDQLLFPPSEDGFDKESEEKVGLFKHCIVFGKWYK